MELDIVVKVHSLFNLSFHLWFICRRLRHPLSQRVNVSRNFYTQGNVSFTDPYPKYVPPTFNWFQVLLYSLIITYRYEKVMRSVITVNADCDSLCGPVFYGSVSQRNPSVPLLQIRFRNIWLNKLAYFCLRRSVQILIQEREHEAAEYDEECAHHDKLEKSSQESSHWKIVKCFNDCLNVHFHIKLMPFFNAKIMCFWWTKYIFKTTLYALLYIFLLDFNIFNRSSYNFLYILLFTIFVFSLLPLQSFIYTF